MKKILLATDFSAAATSALNYVIALNKYFSAELLVLNVVQEQVALPMDEQLQLEIDTQKTDAAHQQIQRWLRPYPNQFESIERIPEEMKFSVRRGPITPTILEVAEEEQVDWIVIGAKNKHHWWEYFLGNISTQLLQQSPVSLLIIPEHVTFGEVDQITLATSTKTESNLVFSKLRLFARAIGANVQKVHVEISDWEEYGERRDNTWIQVAAKSVTQGLGQFAESYKVGMISLEVAQKNFWEQLTHHSISREMILKTEVPLIILKDR